jgi:hypothetical protein
MDAQIMKPKLRALRNLVHLGQLCDVAQFKNYARVYPEFIRKA